MMRLAVLRSSLCIALIGWSFGGRAQGIPDSGSTLSVARPKILVLSNDIVSDLRRIQVPPSRFSTLRVALAMGLGVTFVASLAGAITATAFHHQPTEGNCDNAPELVDPSKSTACLWNLRTLMAVGYVVSGASGVGLGLTFGFPRRGP